MNLSGAPVVFKDMSNKLDYIQDQLLVMDAQRGNADAMTRLVERWQKRLWCHALRLVSDQQAAWDVIQQSWLSIIKGIRRLNDPECFKPWVYRIVTNKALDWMRKRKKGAQLSMDDIAEPQAVPATETGIGELLGKLDMKKKLVICLHYLEELSIPEIAAALRVPAGTVKSRLHAARNDLKALWLEQDALLEGEAK